MWGAVGHFSGVERYLSIKERGGRVPPREAQEGVLGRWDLAR